ncbi:hypothetical protein BDR07DRAFT_1224317, partial [Suillus spraguei]
VGVSYPCSFCGHSGMPECTIMIVMPNNVAPTWTTACMYKHTFRYRSADVGSKTTPCCNVHLKCKLCHPSTVVSVDAVWHYNMPEHILSEHEEYSMPGHREARVALPASILRAMSLTELEQKAARIPK